MSTTPPTASGETGKSLNTIGQGNVWTLALEGNVEAWFALKKQGANTKASYTSGRGKISSSGGIQQHEDNAVVASTPYSLRATIVEHI